MSLWGPFLPKPPECILLIHATALRIIIHTHILIQFPFKGCIIYTIVWAWCNDVRKILLTELFNIFFLFSMTKICLSQMIYINTLPFLFCVSYTDSSTILQPQSLRAGVPGLCQTHNNEVSFATELLLLVLKMKLSGRVFPQLVWGFNPMPSAEKRIAKSNPFPF